MYEVESRKCNLGEEHVVKERWICDYCRGIIAEATPHRLNWFGKGLVSEIKQFQPLGETARQIITVIYRPQLGGMNPIEFHFCSLSHALEFFRKPRPGMLPADTLEFNFTLQAVIQAPIQGPQRERG